MQDEPNANVSEAERREAVADEVGAPLLVAESALEQLGSYLDDDPHLADVEVSSASETDLHVPDACRARPGFLGAVHRLGDEVGQECGQPSQLTVGHIARAGHIDEWHDVILSAGSARRADPAVGAGAAADGDLTSDRWGAYASRVPRRTTLRQRIVYLARLQLADTDAEVTESKLLPDADTGESREVDVVIEGNLAGDHVTIGVEVIEHTRPADVTWVEQQLRKHERLPINKTVLVSWSGFTGPALKKIRATQGKAVAVTPKHRPLDEPLTLHCESFRLTVRDVVAAVRRRTGDATAVVCRWGDEVTIFDETGVGLCSLEQLAHSLLHGRPDVMRALADEFHKHEEKAAVDGFTLGRERLDEIPGMAPVFVRWESTGELHQVVGLEVHGDFEGDQSKLEFEGLLLDGHAFGVAHGSLLGRSAVWVGSQTTEDSATLSWRFLDAPPGS